MTPDDALKLAAKIESTKPVEALDIYLQVEAVAPQHLQLVLKIAQLASITGRQQLALEKHRRAYELAPRNAKIAIAFAELLSGEDYGSALDVLDAVAPADFVERYELLSTHLRLSEWKERQARALPIHHATAMDECPFKFCSPEPLRNLALEWSKAAPSSDAPLWAMAMSQIASKKYDEASASFRTLRTLTPNDPRTWMDFTPPNRTRVSLPDVVTVRQGPDREALYLACDSKYLKRFGVPLLRSIAKQSPGLAAHIHLMGSDPDELAVTDGIALDISSTFEAPAAFIAAHNIKPQMYFGAVRLLRFVDKIEKLGVPLWLMDVDAVAATSPGALFSRPGDLAMRVRAGRTEPWHQFSACLLKGSARSLEYFGVVADYIAASLDRLWWGLDQFALFAAYVNTRPSLTLLGPREADIGDFREDSVFWFTAGSAKARILAEIPLSAEDVATTRFVKELRRHMA